MRWEAKPEDWDGGWMYLFTWDVGAEILAEAIERWLDEQQG